MYKCIFNSIITNVSSDNHKRIANWEYTNDVKEIYTHSGLYKDPWKDYKFKVFLVEGFQMDVIDEMLFIPAYDRLNILYENEVLDNKHIIKA